MQRDPLMERMLRTERRLIHYGFEPTREQFYEWLILKDNSVSTERKSLLLDAYNQGKTYDELYALLDMPHEVSSWYLTVDILIDIHVPDSFI